MGLEDPCRSFTHFWPDFCAWYQFLCTLTSLCVSFLQTNNFSYKAITKISAFCQIINKQSISFYCISFDFFFLRLYLPMRDFFEHLIEERVVGGFFGEDLCCIINIKLKIFRRSRWFFRFWHNWWRNMIHFFVTFFAHSLFLLWYYRIIFQFTIVGIFSTKHSKTNRIPVPSRWQMYGLQIKPKSLSILPI